MASGEKTIELRRRRLRVRPGTTVWVYSKAPRATVDVSATVESVVAGSPEQLWKSYGQKLGISRSELMTYLSDAEVGYAVVLKNIQTLDRRVRLSDLREHCRWFHPPQFFKRLEQDSL